MTAPIDKQAILRNICYTELVYDRINKKLGTKLSKHEIETLIAGITDQTEINYFQKKGKNFYISNRQQNIRITINSNTFRVITVDRI
jgi:hypothetical protein